MSDNLSELADKVHTLSARFEQIDIKLDLHREKERAWVREIIEPIQAAVTRMEAVVASLSKDATSLFAAHDCLLKDTAAREKQQLEERTPMGLVKKYAPVIVFLLSCIALYRILGGMAEVWLKTHGF